MVDASSIQTCRVTGVKFERSPSELAQLERVGTLGGLLSEPLLPPPIHPLELSRQYYSFGTLISLFKSKSAVSGKFTLSRYNPALPCRVCTTDEFFGDRIDNTEFGKPYDFSRPFFDQWRELLLRCYLPPLNAANLENSDYVNAADNAKNCYLCFSVVNSQDCLYCVSQYNGHDNLLCVGSNMSRYCFDCVDIENCYTCQSSRHLINCHDCIGCYDCIGCSNCFGCCGLRNSSFCIFNEAVTEEDYCRRLESFELGRSSTRQAAMEKAWQFIGGLDRRYVFLRNTENCSGQLIHNSKNCAECYSTYDCQDCGYLYIGIKSRDCWYGWGVESELSWLSGPVKSHSVACCYSIFASQQCAYCYFCFQNCSKLFGCVGLRRKEHCILNYQYSRSEFEELMPRIISAMKNRGEWGSFFPPHFSPHAYNESCAVDYLDPISDAEIRRRGYILNDEQAAEPAADAIDAGEIPDDIADVDAEVWRGKSVRCAESGRPFNYQKQEIEFCKRHSLPLQRVHWLPYLKRLMRLRGVFPAV